MLRGAEQMRGNRTHGGIPRLAIVARRTCATGEHPVGGGPVIAVAVRETADHRALVHHLGVLRQQFTDINPRDVGVDRLEGATKLRRCVGLHVKRVELRGTAVHPDQNHGLLRAGGGMREPSRFGTQQIGQAEAKGPNRSHLQHLPPRNVVAKCSRTGSLAKDVEHCWSPVEISQQTICRQFIVSTVYPAAGQSTNRGGAVRG